MKKFFKWIVFLLIIVIIFMFVSSYIFNSFTNKTWMERRLGNILNYQVKILKIDKNILSAVFGISLFDVQIITERKTEEEDKEDKGDYILIKKIVLFPDFLKIIFNRFNIQKIILEDAEIVLKSEKNWRIPFIKRFLHYNFYYKENKETGNKKEKPGLCPVSIDSFNVPINLKNIIIKNSSIRIINDALKQKLFLININGQIYDIALDPEDLFLKNQVKIKLKSGIKIFSEEKTLAFLDARINGKCIPFNNFDRLFDPRMQLEFKSGYGFIERTVGLKEVKSVPDMRNYCNGFDFFENRLSWNNFFVKVWLSKPGASFKEGLITNNKYSVNYAGRYENTSDAMDLVVVLSLHNEYNLKLAEIIDENIMKKFKYRVKSIDKLKQVSVLFINRLKDKSGNIKFKYSMKGNVAKPEVLLIIPEIKSFNDELNKIIKSRHSNDR